MSRGYSLLATTLEAFPKVGVVFSEHHYHTQAQRARRNEQEIWTAVAKEPPVFRIAGTASGPLRHDVRAAAVVDVAARARRADAQPFRMVEVGVFQGNLSKHIWQRSAARPGAFELHLVDHWGAPYVPLATRKELEESLGTGSNMAGQSNNSALQRLWHHFGAKGARRFEVPHWLGEKRACGETTRAAASSADLFVHRSASIAPARCFLDGSLDLVYIDADHKWWSVLQDLTTWWPKIKPGGVMMGHDFHFNSLMERASLDGGDINDVPLAVGAFFRWPTTVSLHSGFVWSVQKPLDSQPNATEAQLQRQDLCDLLRRTAGLIWQFFREKKHAKGQTTSNQMGYSISRCPQGNFILIMNLRFVQTTIPQTRKEL
ncbi:Uncharacterized protein SCF082_LOCUS3153 [Durusdinium trenchii]|uniref:Uncharacterized protein n=1 Tax=Durusdinium trenchii TaxID=1381693 RepID=A0ABP0HQZ4_9DINO